MEKCTSDKLEICCMLRRDGLSKTAIAKNVGIDRKTLSRWIKKGENTRGGKFKRFYDKWLDAEEQYLIVNPPKNTYNPKHARETIPGYAKFKKRVLKRDGYTCVCCGYDDKLQVHHIYGAKEHPDMATDLDNGVTLCEYCHKKYHHIYSRYGMNANDFYEFMNNFKVVR